jgi:hypothetical protein
MMNAAVLTAAVAVAAATTGAAFPPFPSPPTVPSSHTHPLPLPPNAGPSWPSPGGSPFRTNAIRYSGPQFPLEHRGSTYAALMWASDGSPAASHSSPLVLELGDPEDALVWVDPSCHVLVFEIPSSSSSSSSPPSHNLPLRLLQNFSEAAARIAPHSYVPCTDSVMATEGGEGRTSLFFADRFAHVVYGLEVTRGSAPLRHLPWSPMQLPVERGFQLLTHHSPLVAAGILYLPLRYAFGTVAIRTADGLAVRVLVDNGTTGGILAGSSGLPPFSPGNEDGGAAAFAVYGGGAEGTGSDPRVLVLNTSGKVVWTADGSKVPFKALSRDDPALLFLPSSGHEGGGGHPCLLLVQQSVSEGDGSPVTLFLLNAANGTACGSWPSLGLPLPDPYADEPVIVGTPAVIDAVGDLPPPSTAAHAFLVAGNSLLHLLLSPTGLVLNATSPLGPPTAPASTAAPVVLLDAWGRGRHAVFVGTSSGALLAFRAEDVGAGPVYAYDLDRAARPDAFIGRPTVVGPYIAATEDGAVLLLVHDAGAVSDDVSSAAIVVVFPAIVPPAPYPAPPAPPSPGPARSTSAGVVLLAVVVTLAGLAGIGTLARAWIRRRRVRRELDASWYTSLGPGRGVADYETL